MRTMGRRRRQGPALGEHCDRCGGVHAPLPQCQAHRARKQTAGAWVQCRARVVRGAQVCRNHGGLTPIGPASPQWRGRGYSRILPTGLRETYEAARSDPELLALDRELALVEARLDQLASRLEGDPVAQAREVQALGEALKAAWDRTDMATYREKLDRLVEAAGKVVATERTWTDILTWQEQRRKLADTERRRREALAATVTTERLLALVVTFVEILRRHIADPRTFRRVAAEVQTLVLVGPKDRSLPVPEAIEA